MLLEEGLEFKSQSLHRDVVEVTYNMRVLSVYLCVCVCVPLFVIHNSRKHLLRLMTMSCRWAKPVTAPLPGWPSVSTDLCSRRFAGPWVAYPECTSVNIPLVSQSSGYSFLKETIM